MSEFLFQSSWLIPCYGLLGAVLTLPWAMGLVRHTGPRPAAYLNLLMTLLAFLHGTRLLWLLLREPAQQLSWHWLRAPGLELSLTLNLSPLTMGVVELVTALSLLAQLFALGYMEKDWALARFFALMGFFEGAMGGLALSDSLFLSYALLEMLTLSTYLLVGFWYAQPLVVTAARDAFLTKRVGDVLLLMGVVALSSLSGSLDFPDLAAWAATNPLSPTMAALVGLALIAGPTGKCAQFPLNLWLDEAMEGPNPASILRNSVVVAGGAYVLIKLQPILVLSPLVLNVLVGMGTVTAIGASLIAIAQIDIKRALSHSTSAYLGLAFIAVGQQQTNLALLLLGVHAIARALVFMSSGAICLTTTSQDITEMGGLWSRMPATTTAFIVGSAGLVGLFPLGGFWGLLQGLQAFRHQPALMLVVLLVNGLTAFNLSRIFRLVFLGSTQPKSRRGAEVDWPMAVPMVSLTIATLLLPLVLQRLQLLPAWGEVQRGAVILLVASGLLGWQLGSRVSLNRTWTRPVDPLLRLVQDFLAYDFYIDRLYRMTVVLAVGSLSRLSNWCDRYIVDGVVNLAALISMMSGEALKYGTSGQSQAYVLTIVVGIGLMLGWLAWSLTGGHLELSWLPSTLFYPSGLTDNPWLTSSLLLACEGLC